MSQAIKPFTLNDVDGECIQVIHNNAEFCVCNSFDEEQESVHYRSEAIANALNLLGDTPIQRGIVNPFSGYIETDSIVSYRSYYLSRVDASTVQVCTDEDTEWCVVNTFEGEGADVQTRAERILVALQYQENEVSRLYDEWQDKYKPVRHPDNSDTIMFETYGDEVAFVGAVKSTHIWTILDCDGQLWLCPGVHRVNRLNYVVCMIPYDENKLPEDVRY